MTESSFSPGGNPSWTRGALLATTLALGLALVAASWANYRGARSAVEPLNRGYAEILDNAIRQAVIPGGRDEADALADVLEDQSEAGLRYVAFLAPDGSVQASAGETLTPVALPSGFAERARDAGILMMPVEDRIRAFIPRPTRGGGSRRGFGGVPGFGGTNPAIAGGASAPGGGVGGPQTPPSAAPGQAGFGQFGLAATVVEFEPLAANQLTARAGRSLLLGSLAAGLLTLAAVLFWRQSDRYEQARRDLEHRRRLSQLGEMSAVLAHEIRNPLASLKGNAQLLAERLPSDSRERKRADRVVAEATRLESLTTDLLDFARSGPIRRDEVDPVELVRLAAEDARPGGVRIEAAGAPASWPVDVRRIRQALTNLLRNAIEASPPDASPIARVVESDGQLVLQVRDFGPGVPQEDRERVFEPFYTTRATGTGLGLPVARRVIELHGGTLTVHAPEDGGALFEIVLPRNGTGTNGAAADH
jgi:two-component system, NtrC family, sensor histidine kinase HydH